MIRVSSTVAPGISLAIALFFPVCACGQGAIELANKIAFLRGQAVWIANSDGSGARKLTHDSTKVNTYLFSPSHRYLAYSTVVGLAREPGLWDSTETAPEREICSIVILDLMTKQTLKQTDSAWVYIAKWLRGDKLLYYTSDGFSVDGYYVYDPHKNSVVEMPLSDERMMESDYSLDGTLEVYPGEYGRDLHLYYRDTDRDTVLISGKRNMYDVRLSNNKRYVAFLEVQDVNHDYFDILWVYDREGSSCISLYRGRSHPKSGGVNYLAWSADDRYIGMLFSPEAIILDVQHPAQAITIAGADLSWIAKDKLIFNRNNDTYVYDLTTGSSKLLIKEADQAVFLR